MYSYRTLINDIETIPYLEDVKTPMLTIAKNKLDENGYIVSVDDAGDLLITLNGVAIAFYNRNANNWIINGVNLNQFITETQATLKNHYDAINILMNQTA